MPEISWIKIKTNIFDDEKIKLIEAMPEADTVLVIWLKLLVQAGKCNEKGDILLTKNIPYSLEMLSTIFNRPLQIIKHSVRILSDMDMIELSNNNIISIANWDKHQNIDGMDKIREQNRIRQQKKRDQKALKDGTRSICSYCGADSKMTIDHIIPTSKGGLDIDENKILCCLDCNMSKTSRELAEFLNSRIISGKPVDINSITHNKKLMTFVSYKNGKFTQKRIKHHVTITPNNAIDKDIELEEEKDKKDIKHKHGEYKHVLLTDGQLSKLIEDFGEQNTKHLIKILDEGIELKGYKYKNHNLAIRNWSKKEKNLPPKQQNTFNSDEYFKSKGIVC